MTNKTNFTLSAERNFFGMVPIGLNTPKKHPKRNPFRSGGVVLLSLILRCVGGYSSIHTNTPDFAHKVHLPHLAKRASVAGYIPDPAPVQRNSLYLPFNTKIQMPKAESFVRWRYQCHRRRYRHSFRLAIACRSCLCPPLL